MQVISVINQKGGVGKTTTTSSIASGLRIIHDKTVLVIDLDSQCNLSLLYQADSSDRTVVDVLTGKMDVIDSIQSTSLGDIIPASDNLSFADSMITGKGREHVLRHALNELKGKYDYIVIDTPPALGLLSISSLTASSGAIIPARADLFSLDAIVQLSGTMKAVKDITNRNLNILGVVITQYSDRVIINRDAANKIAETAQQIGTSLFDTRIRECAAIRESQALRKNIFEYAPRSNAAKDYKALVNEIERRLDNGK